jgi:hypothetical protein
MRFNGSHLREDFFAAARLEKLADEALTIRRVTSTVQQVVRLAGRSLKKRCGGFKVPTRCRFAVSQRQPSGCSHLPVTVHATLRTLSRAPEIGVFPDVRRFLSITTPLVHYRNCLKRLIVKAKMQREKNVQATLLPELSMICRCALRASPDRTREEDDAVINQLADVMREALNSELLGIQNATLFHSCAAAAQVVLDVAARIDEVTANIASSAVDPTYLM